MPWSKENDICTSDPELTRKPWDRQPGESAKAFRAFVFYRDLVGNRTYQDVAHMLHCSGSNIRRWAGRWNWYGRAREWDIYEDQKAQEAQIRERKRMAKRTAEGGLMLQTIALFEASKLRERLENGIEVHDPTTGEIRRVNCSLSASEIAKLYEIGTSVERRARGEDDEQQVAKIEVIFARKRTSCEEMASTDE